MDAAAEPAAVAARRAHVNSAVSVWAAAAIISFGPALLFNLMPLVLSSLATAHSLGPAQVGLFASACQAGSMVSTLASALWVRRVRSWPRATVVSALLTAAAYGCIMAVDGASYPATLAFAFVTGCGNGSLHAAPTALLSDTKSPTRGFALTIGLQVLAAGAVAPFAPAIQARWGFPGMIGVLSAFTALCAALSLLLPLQGLRGSSVGGGTHRATAAAAPAATGEGSESSGRKPSNVPVFLALGGFMVFYVSVTGVYAFVALQGQTWGLSENQISSAVTVALLVGCGGSFLVGVLADRFVSPVTLVVVFVAGTASAFGCLMLGGSGSEHSYTTFRLALLQLNVWWNGAASVMSGVIATLDRSGRFAVLSQAYAIGIAKHTQPTYPSTTSNETTLLSLVTS